MKASQDSAAEGKTITAQGQAQYCQGYVGGTEVSTRPTITGQDILIQSSDIGRGLADLLADEEIEFVQQVDLAYWCIPHSQRIDALLTELIDLFISIRYAHPSLVQLDLALTEDQWAEAKS